MQLPFQRMLAGVLAAPPEGLVYDKQHVRMFVASHLCGPFIGLAMAVVLLMLGFPLDYRIFGFVGLVGLFWAYPFALAAGAGYRTLSLCSLQHLALVIVWASHGYGGLASPFLLWLAVMPLLAFLYLSPTLAIWLQLAAIIAFNVAALAGVASFVAAPPAVPAGALQWLALVSVLCASIYVSLMAAHFGRVLNSRLQVEQEAARQEQTAASLAHHTAELRRAGADKAAIIGKVGRDAAIPLMRIGAACAQLEREAESEPGQDASDLRSIAEAARYLSDVVRDVAQYARLETGEQALTSSTVDLNALLHYVSHRADELSGAIGGQVLVEEAEPGLTISSDPRLLEVSVLQLICHLGGSHSALPLTLRGSRLRGEAGDHVTIDVFRDYGADPAAAQAMVERRPIGEAPARATGGSLNLTLASRIAALLGGGISPHPARPNGSHFRIELPVEPVRA